MSVSESCEVREERLSWSCRRCLWVCSALRRRSCSGSAAHVASSVHVYLALRRMLGNNLLVVLCGGWFLPAAAGVRGGAFCLPRISLWFSTRSCLRFVKDGSFGFRNCSSRVCCFDRWVMSSSLICWRSLITWESRWGTSSEGKMEACATERGGRLLSRFSPGSWRRLLFVPRGRPDSTDPVTPGPRSRAGLCSRPCLGSTQRGRPAAGIRRGAAAYTPRPPGQCAAQTGVPGRGPMLVACVGSGAFFGILLRAGGLAASQVPSLLCLELAGGGTRLRWCSALAF